MNIGTFIIYLICLIGIIIIGKIFIVPIKWILKLLINSILGAVILAAINTIGSLWGIHVGINFVTAVIVGVLGVPGAALLVVFSVFF